MWVHADSMCTVSTVVSPPRPCGPMDSRGAHYREDFPETDHEHWLRNIYTARNGAGPKLWTEPVKLPRLNP